jgi:hypothetical protein
MHHHALGFFIIMNKTFYFSHDYNARTDEKIKKLLMKHGMVGYGIYWSIIEDLYNNANALQLDCERIAYELRTDELIVKSVINDFALFQKHDDFFSSDSVQKRLSKRIEISESASKSAKKRWEKLKHDANAMPTQSESNASAMQRKGKERKEYTCFTFDEFWNLYGKKLDTKKCKDNFNKLTEKEKEQIKSTISNYINSTPDIQYRKNPLTYLRGKCWQDEIKQEIKLDWKGEPIV